MIPLASSDLIRELLRTATPPGAWCLGVVCGLGVTEEWILRRAAACDSQEEADEIIESVERAPRPRHRGGL